ncbi:MAG: glutamate--tRNA ligase [bacterium]|nr:glutamate--tRNA ligase [bacterium]
MQNKDKIPEVRTRTAPSPTGFIHIGNLRTALYAYLFAKQHSGKFILRLEDTDTERYVKGAAEAIYSGLKWAGLQYDEGPDIGGHYAPYVQSQRLEIYKKYANELIEKDYAYYCFCDKETLEKMRNEQTTKKQAPKYDKRCLALSKDEIDAKLKANEPRVIRMKIPENRVLKFNDIVRGELVFNTNELDDQVLLKSDGYPTYFLAVTVDDYLTKITHVTRTEEWISSFPKLILLYEYFDWEMPQFAHLPLLLNPDKTKMSKRMGDVAVGDYIKKGYLPHAMINFLTFLGWNPGTEKEIYLDEEITDEKESLQKLLQNLMRDFDLNKAHKAGAIFNIEKLNWFNQFYIKRLSDELLLEKCRPYLPENKNNFSGAQIIKMLNLEKERAKNLSEIGEGTKFFFELPQYEVSLLTWKNTPIEKIKNALEILRDIVEKRTGDNFTKEKLQETIMLEAEKFENKGIMLWPFRVALSGQKASPGPFEIAEILGKKETLKRLHEAILMI